MPFAGQAGARREVKENGKMQGGAGRNTLVEKEQVTEQPSLIKTEASFVGGEAKHIIAGWVYTPRIVLSNTPQIWIQGFEAKSRSMDISLRIEAQNLVLSLL